MSLVECIPNFSEGRRQWVVDAIAESIRASSVHVLDVNLDYDHNRSVITFAGEPTAVADAAVAAVRTAAAHIDLRTHSGVHPRIGAADVVPFVPLRDVTMAECVALAHAVGQRVAGLGIPVYLYEAAAQRPERCDLAYVRRGGYEALVREIDLPERQPDYGAALIGAAGAVAIGARAPLIAFNAYLDTDDVEIAKVIAKTIRTSGGGLPYLKAIGVLVNGQAQVSMNMTDFRQTSLYTIMTRLHAEAAAHDTRVTHTELIGLTPQAALLDYAMESLGLPLTTRQRTLESRLGEVTGDFRPLTFE
ncbi:MAG: glutamate formimidoyltransferase [Chloroflexota bacterium]|nr:glutamate formimidoyltransferase [Chloroflexota bacterium]